MKRKGLVFAVECIIILLLLLNIGLLVKDKNQDRIGTENEAKETSVVVLEDTAEEEGTEEVVPAALMPEENMVEEEKVVSGESQKELVTVEEKIADENTLKVVVFGDSIWAGDRGTDGISELIMEQRDIKIYNCAIGGTTAALTGDGSANWDEWTHNSFNGMMYIANDAADADELIPNDAACEVIKSVDFDEIDYVIVSYGLNDYFCDVPIYPQEYYDVRSFVGALRNGISKLKKEHPNLEIIVTSPTYCGWFEGERQFELGTYVESARGVAAEMEVHFLDMYHALGKNPEEKVRYLEDGVHLTLEGRKLYANSVITLLDELESLEENVEDESLE